MKVTKNLYLKSGTVIEGAKINQAQKLIKLYQNETNNKILDFLRQREKAKVTDIWIHLRTEQSFVSQHLKTLLKAKLIGFTKFGKEHLYSVNSNTVTEIEGLLYNLGGEHSGEVFRALTHDLRLSMMQFMEDKQDRTVSQLHKALDIGQSVCSANLKILREANLVIDEHRGRKVIYSVNHEYLNRVNNAVKAYFYQNQAVKI